jgi:RNA polymerase sigma-70 factor (ECF subfamily)
MVETDSVLHLNKEDDKEKQYEYLESALQQLNDEQKKCLDLFYFKDKSYVEIAEITGYTINEVKSYIQNGKRNLRIKLENLRGKVQS